MDDVMTIEEINTRFPDEIILIDQPEHDADGQLSGGRVVCHTRDRNEITVEILKLPTPHHVAVHYNFRRKPDHIFML